ncbi:MAG: carbon starvation protein [Phycisphaerales bacterium]|jgi:carbon starvation protein|nr:carbon starvation protein [Phycisphaerales bacterium]
MSAMPIMIGVLCVMAIAYRYYSAFLAAKVAALDDSRETPAVRLNDGQNYHPTNKWVLFGHHFAAISGAGPLIGPVLAAQFGYLPGLLWIVIGVCLGGAVQDFLVLAASLRRNGQSLAQIAYTDIGKVAGTAAITAILFIIVIALAGLGKVVVKALGGEEVVYPPSSLLIFPEKQPPTISNEGITAIPAGTQLWWGLAESKSQSMRFTDGFNLKVPVGYQWEQSHKIYDVDGIEVRYPPGAVRLVPGSSWGTFTIACTIPIALFVGLYMYKIRKGRVVEASIIGGVLTLVATVAGGWIASHEIGKWFNMTQTQVTIAMAIYGFVASVLPVWVLLCPRDYLSSFLKIGTIGLLVGGVIIANPKLQAPAFNEAFAWTGGPTVKGKIFPYLFITIMCGAISGFHALVSSGTTPKMIRREGDARTIGYGAMLIEGLVGVVAMIAAATLPMGDYYAMNTDLARVPQFHDKFVQIGADIDHLNVYEDRTQESLRGRAGGAVTLAVGMAHIFDQATARITTASEATLKTMWKYWYHFAIMFEALFILTTIDTGTRIGRFLIQEVAGKLHPKLGKPDWWPGAIVSTALIVAGWAFLIDYNNFMTIWGMFGIANQMLAVIALAVVTVFLFNEGRGRYAFVTLIPMAVVMTTTGSAAILDLSGLIDTVRTQIANGSGRNVGTLVDALVRGGLILAMLTCTAIVIIAGAAQVLRIGGKSELRRDVAVAAAS